MAAKRLLCGEPFPLVVPRRLAAARHKSCLLPAGHTGDHVTDVLVGVEWTEWCWHGQSVKEVEYTQLTFYG